jgi:uncharacterized membrane-anchored protein YhcB (DUF1043 family)
MSGPDKEDLIRFAAVLDEFVAAQREQALVQTKRQRITVTRPVGDMHVQFETLVDESASPAEIFDVLAPLDTALDRLKAKVDLSSHYERMANLCGQIEMSAHKLATDRAKFQADNEARNERRRTPIVLTQPQRTALDQHRQAITDSFERIAELKKAAAECRQIIGGEDPFAVLDRQIEERLDRLRGARPDAA